jgi:phage terminase large subunit
LVEVGVDRNIVVDHLINSKKRITVEQGGSRSGKTYNILVWVIFYYCSQNEGHTVTICRKTFPSLRASVMRDFLEILQRYEIYEEKYHNKTNNEYALNGNLVEFISLDQPQKIRGRKRNLLYINEANELYFEDWQQLIMRTTGKVVIDYNPSDAFHWIYDKVIPREDCEFFKTTYKDNPFLEPELVKEIERLQGTDDDYWRIYGLGERGSSRATIFQFGVVSEPYGELLSIGLDFGYTNDPTALVKVYKRGNELIFDELLYHTNLTNQDIAQKFDELELNRMDIIYADSAEPKSIEELHRMRWNVKPTVKGADSIMAGIDMLKRYELKVTAKSLNLIKEFQNYKWIEDKNGNLLNKPVDNYNHAIDAIRYAVYNKLSKPNYGSYAIR